MQLCTQNNKKNTYVDIDFTRPITFPTQQQQADSFLQGLALTFPRVV